jgi:protein-tyrosine phosphatase/arsenate reductase
MLFPTIQAHCDQLITQFASIPAERRVLLQKISDYVRSNQTQHLPVNLVYICTHNSRRSHFGQIWSAVAAAYYHVFSVSTFSGGTEATVTGAVLGMTDAGDASTHCADGDGSGVTPSLKNCST